MDVGRLLALGLDAEHYLPIHRIWECKGEGHPMESKAFLARIEFDPEKLTKEYVEEVLRRRVGGRGVSIKVAESPEEIPLEG
ncbi:MAG: hypothetical protein N3F65_04415 [Nitrososphaeria archaeon]|nr:hypothetical protein [Nitrososphaeria archaeon]